MRLNKKSQIQYFLWNFLRITIAVVGLFAFIIMVNFYVNNKIDSRLLQAEVLSNRILYSDMITVQDPKTFRVYSGIIDMNKLNDSSVLDQSMPYMFRKHVAAKIKIYGQDVQGKRVFLKEVYYNKEQWDYWTVLLKNNIYGKGSASQIIKEFPVTCAYDKDINRFNYCILVVEVIVPNS